MAKLLSDMLMLWTTVLLLFNVLLAGAEKAGFSRSLSPKSVILNEEKLTHLHFYFHDIVTGKNPTTATVASAPTTNSSSTEFGKVMMMDDPLTVGPELNSKMVGRAQGIYAFASQEEVALLMVLNFAFQEGIYNGSHLSVLGRNEIFSDVREMPIVGGTGVFRFARGYAQARTYWVDRKTRNAVVEYNVYVFHY